MQIIENAVLEKVDISGYKFTYNNCVDFMAIEDVIKPNKQKIELAIEKLIDKNPFLVNLNDIKIFLFPYKLRVYENRSWTESAYLARAYDNHIVVGGMGEGENIESVLCHEIFHVFQKRFFNDLSEYKRLRNIPSSWNYDSGYYYKRYGEMFAEDCRHFFGTSDMQYDFVDYYQEIAKPSIVIKDYILSKCPPYEEIVMQIGNKNYSVNQIPKVMDTPPQIINSRTMIPIRAVSESLGATVLWNQQTKTVRILKKSGD